MRKKFSILYLQFTYTAGLLQCKASTEGCEGKRTWVVGDTLSSPTWTWLKAIMWVTFAWHMTIFFTRFCRECEHVSHIEFTTVSIILHALHHMKNHTLTEMLPSSRLLHLNHSREWNLRKAKGIRSCWVSTCRASLKFGVSPQHQDCIMHVANLAWEGKS